LRKGAPGAPCSAGSHQVRPHALWQPKGVAPRAVADIRCDPIRCGRHKVWPHALWQEFGVAPRAVADIRCGPTCFDKHKVWPQAQAPTGSVMRSGARAGSWRTRTHTEPAPSSASRTHAEHDDHVGQDDGHEEAVGDLVEHQLVHKVAESVA